MHVYSPVFQGQLIEKKIRSITFIVLVLGRVKKIPKKIFQGLFKNIVFRSVALVIKKLWAILDIFFTHSRLFTALYPTLCVKKNYKKNPSNYYL